jgi:hypothetical protein
MTVVKKVILANWYVQNGRTKNGSVPYRRFIS